MSGGLERLRQVMADYLRSRGVPAVTAWPMLPRAEREEPVVAVSVRGCRAVPAGLQDYLGERYDPETGRWEERYGRKAEITFGLDIYGPEKGDGAMVRAAFDALAEALLLGGPEELEIREFSCGSAARDGESRRLKLPVEAACAAYLCTAAGDGGVFHDFELRGVAKA